MDANFWKNRWETKDIPFHEPKANPLLVKYFKEFALPKGSRVFVPLCGKTLDIRWLLSKGYRVAGAELIELAVEELFQELKLKPAITAAGKLKHYSAKNIDIFVGDIFQLSGKRLGPVDAVYDRAALVALPPAVRKKYAEHMRAITGTAPQLLVTFEYDQRLMDGPPFSIGNEEVERHYEGHFDLKLLSSADIPGGLKGRCKAVENVWLLRKS